MTADVYAGDDGLNVPGAGAHAGTRILLIVRADPDPGLLVKLATALRAANILPVAASLVRDSASLVVFSVELRAASATLADLLRRKLEQVIDVHSVELILVAPPAGAQSRGATIGN